MDIYFKTKKNIIKMGDRLNVKNVKNNFYITTSNLNMENETPICKVETEQVAINFINQVGDLINVLIKQKEKDVIITIDEVENDAKNENEKQ